MAEYISRNELLRVINSNVAEAHNERCTQLLEAILNAPTADVVPRSEVDKSREINNSLLEAGQEWQKRYENLAREIFAEIEKIINKHHNECYEYEDGDECDTAITYLSYLSIDIDELKKKYTEE